MKNYPFRSHLGVTGYVTVGTRPDSAYAYKTLASFNDCHGPLHRDALQDFIGYLAVTADTHTLKLGKGGGDQIVAYCDADWNGTECHRSTTGLHESDTCPCAHMQVHTHVHTHVCTHVCIHVCTHVYLA